MMVLVGGVKVVLKGVEHRQDSREGSTDHQRNHHRYSENEAHAD